MVLPFFTGSGEALAVTLAARWIFAVPLLPQAAKPYSKLTLSSESSSSEVTWP
jgi:hypothetical protein